MTTPATYVLLPGAGGDAWYWHLVAPLLEARGHEVLAVDLPCGDDSAGLAEYADTVVGAVDGRTRVVLVAQSMAAFTATMACERVDVGLLILVAPMIPAPGESPGQWWSATGQSAARRENDLQEGRDPDGAFDAAETFLHDLPAPTLGDALARGEPRQSDRPFADPWPLEAWPDVPTRAVVGRHDRLFPLAFSRRIARERLGLDVEVIDTGHLPALSRPDELARRLEAYRVEAR